MTEGVATAPAAIRPAELLALAGDSLRAARVLAREGFSRFAAARAWYAMAYAAGALLVAEGRPFSRHADSLVAGFGECFAKPGLVPDDFQRWLIEAMEMRNAGDFGGAMAVTAEDAARQIERAQRFVDGCRPLLGEA